MIRFSWMQFRVQGWLALGGLTIVAIVLAVTGTHLVHLYDTTVANCSAHGDCSCGDHFADQLRRQVGHRAQGCDGGRACAYRALLGGSARSPRA